MADSVTELAWAAGFFDGEGWIGSKGQKHHNLRYAQIGVQQSRSPELLLRLQDALGGIGRITGPTKRPTNKVNYAPFYQFAIYARDDVVKFARLMWPYLGSRNRQRVFDSLLADSRLPLKENA